MNHHPRYRGVAEMHNGRARWTGEIRLDSGALDKPLHWVKPRTVFVASMGDLFHAFVPGGFVCAVFDIILRTPQHTYLVLTKRPETMLKFFGIFGSYANLPNVWLGVTAENQEAADERIPLLLRTPAAVRFVSCEPLLEAVDLKKHLDEREWPDYTRGAEPEFITRPGLNWVIAGGETGPGARPMRSDWAQGLRDQCRASGIPYFHKQNGVWTSDPDIASVATDWCGIGKPPDNVRLVGNTWMVRVDEKRAGHLLDGQVIREWPK